MDFQYNFGNLTHHPYPPPVSRSVYSSEEEEETALDEQIGLVLFFVATIVSVLLVGVCSLRQYYCNYSDVTDTCFPKIFRRGISPQSRTSSEQYHVDRILAETLQRRLNEEERERERQAKRKERRMWYDYYMKPCTLVSNKWAGNTKILMRRCIFFSVTDWPLFFYSQILNFHFLTTCTLVNRLSKSPFYSMHKAKTRQILVSSSRLKKEKKRTETETLW